MEIFKQLPFDTSKNPINLIQGFHGPWSHQNFIPKLPMNLSYCVDFALPINTVILAVKGGIVNCVQDSSDLFYQGIDTKIGIGFSFTCNFVGIKDPNNKTETHYMHLAKDSVKVKVGDIINPGDMLAKTGMSGWVGPIPHIHFQLSEHKYGKHKGRNTLPFKFEDYPESLEYEDNLIF